MRLLVETWKPDIRGEGKRGCRARGTSQQNARTRDHKAKITSPTSSTASTNDSVHLNSSRRRHNGWRGSEPVGPSPANCEVVQHAQRTMAPQSTVLVLHRMKDTKTEIASFALCKLISLVWGNQGEVSTDELLVNSSKQPLTATICAAHNTIHPKLLKLLIILNAVLVLYWNW